MNARQMKKNLKKQIDKLQSDNKLMFDIIADSPSMQKTYDRWTKPLNVTHSSMRFQKFKVKRIVLTRENEAVDTREIECAKQLAAIELLDGIKDSDIVTYEIDTEQRFLTVTASIIVAYNDQKEV